MKDYYAILGVPRDAGEDVIKKRFRQLARETHPDANPGDPEAEARFRDIAEAYEVLSDGQRRAAYDRGESFDAGDLFSSFAGVEDLLNAFFGGAFGGGFGGGRVRGRSGQPRGPDVGTVVELTLEEAATGIERDVTFATTANCAHCEGGRAEPGHPPVPCRVCGGSGSRRVERRTLLGNMTTIGPCETCRGAGEIIEQPCSQCRGAGVEQAERTLSIEIPAGIGDGARLRLTGRGGAAGAGALPGDLYVEVRIAADARFRRDGDDLHHVAPVGIAAAALGTTYRVPLLDGDEAELDIPAGTQPAAVFRFPGKGMPRLQRRGRGDLYVTVDVQVPTKLTAEERDALVAYADLAGEAHTRKRRRLRK